jgi:hypothetical protein
MLVGAKKNLLIIFVLVEFIKLAFVLYTFACNKLVCLSQTNVFTQVQHFKQELSQTFLLTERAISKLCI